MDAVPVPGGEVPCVNVALVPNGEVFEVDGTVGANDGTVVNVEVALLNEELSENADVALVPGMKLPDDVTSLQNREL